MRWFRIRRADIDPQWRTFFEQYGVETMRVYLAEAGSANPYSDRNIRVADRVESLRELTPPLLLWLTEQYDRAERKETWSLTMEVAITIFVLAEVLLSLFRR